MNEEMKCSVKVLIYGYRVVVEMSLLTGQLVFFDR